eukprot:gb/GEZN01003838.1/.p1 GENE.gb/GEZN01003838.1/~~gb/GEZN01003838.1/.p1  ORF type:complete len:375 (+),score=39.99 gb/GEZN01003838.1/:43-1125(+)
MSRNLCAPLKKCCFVTGTAGFVGSHAALHLLERGHTVVGVDNLSRGSTQALSVLQKFPRFKFAILDLGDKPAVDQVFQQHPEIDTVFHFAALAFPRESVKFPELYQRNITSNTKILVDAMIRHQVPLLVYSSTCAVYGSETKFPVTEDSPLLPDTPYGQTKLDAENYIRSKASPTFQAHLMRYFNVVGADHMARLGENPRPELAEYGRLWTSCVDVALKQRPYVTIFDCKLDTPDGTAIRDYVHVEDLVRAHVAVLKVKCKDYLEVWNVATGKPSSTLNFVKTAERVAGVPIPVFFAEGKKSSDPPKMYGDAAKLRQATGWTPEYAKLDAILATSWAWAAKQRLSTPKQTPTVIEKEIPN